jgi:hypothetical protein
MGRRSGRKRRQAEQKAQVAAANAAASMPDAILKKYGIISPILDDYQQMLAAFITGGSAYMPASEVSVERRASKLREAQALLDKAVITKDDSRKGVVILILPILTDEAFKYDCGFQAWIDWDEEEEDGGSDGIPINHLTLINWS